MIFSYLKIEVHKDDHFLQSKNKKQQIKMDVRKRFYFCMIENLKLSATVFYLIYLRTTPKQNGPCKLSHCGEYLFVIN